MWRNFTDLNFLLASYDIPCQSVIYDVGIFPQYIIMVPISVPERASIKCRFACPDYVNFC